MKLAINLGLSLAMLAVCTYLVWPDDPDQIREAFERVAFSEFWPYLAGYFGLLAITHLTRSLRWNDLLRPIGAAQPTMRLLAISSVGFMAILALPARLGEFVRPALIRKRGHISAAAALGTIAVERIVDGLMVSLFVFVAVFGEYGTHSPWWAYVPLVAFAGALLFLLFAMRWPVATINVCLACTLLPFFRPELADKLREMIASIIRGFKVLGDFRNLVRFSAWSIAYWFANSLSLWLLAHGFGIDLSLLAAAAVTCIVAIGIVLPNSPGLVGQYHVVMVAGLTLYMGAGPAEKEGLALAILVHGLQVVWYVGVGAIALASKHVSFAEFLAARRAEEEST